MHLLLATSNPGKAREFRRVLQPLGFEIESLETFPDLPAAEETESTFKGNARLKARHYHQLTGLPALADDSGLEVDALGGRPGVRSSRLADSDPERIRRLLEMLAREAPQRDSMRSARFVCALCLVTPEKTWEVEGRVEGLIIDTPRGRHGFGYDPLFYFPPLDRTFAQIPPQTKNRISHRADALKKLLALLRQESAGPIDQC
ncbi:MAG TPA: RdgB/HAM1 family non-canonical purine NTP pyrophosphatase [Acidobacteriota bacterium]|nr:RdgB/HAM1 family non-canonical purine NTP pyrophosphatase [Acidobacteriota bacterium]